MEDYTLPGATKVKAMASGGRDNIGEQSAFEEAISPNHNFNSGATFGFLQGGHPSQRPPTAQSEDGAAKREDDEAVRSKTDENTKHTRLHTTLSTTSGGASQAKPRRDEVVIPNLPQDNGVVAANIERQRQKIFSSPVAHILREDELMDYHISYHQNITGEEAEKRLKKCGSHCYLTRYSDVNRCYMLTVLRKKPTYAIKHFKIFFQHYPGNKVYKIDGKTQEFRGIGEMLGHYENDKIDPAFADIGRCITEQEYTSKWCTIL